jgi:CheY-like chemotaxis protein
MEQRAKQQAAFRSAIAENRRLVSEIHSNLRDLDQLWAARKDAMAKGRDGELARGPRLGSEGVGRFARGEVQSHNLLLVVDDDQDDFVLLERALKKVEAVVPVFWAQDGGEAIDALERFNPLFQNICVVVDIQLPDMSGFELVQAIRARQLPNQVRFVFVTGNPNPQLRTRALNFGADDFFVKPCRHSDFLEIAHRLNELCNEPAHARE